MEVLSLLHSIVALAIAIPALGRTAGVKDLTDQRAALRSTLDSVRRRPAHAPEKVER